LTFQVHEDLDAFAAMVAILENFSKGGIVNFKNCEANENVCHDR